MSVYLVCSQTSTFIVMVDSKKMNRDAEKNALELQQVLQEITVPTPFSDVAALDSPESILIPMTNNSNSPLEVSEMGIIESSKGRDKLFYTGFIYNFQREGNGGKKQWRCEVKNCKGAYAYNWIECCKRVRRAQPLSRDRKGRSFSISSRS